MMPWIESHTSLAHHPKTMRLARRLSISPPAAVGHLHFLWWWAIEYAQDGDLSSYDDAEIADACGWDGDAALLRAALTAAGFLDNDGAIHDWDDYAGKLLDQRKANAEKQKRWRNRHVTVTSAGSNGNVTPPAAVSNRDVTVTQRLRTAATVPNPTVQDRTQPEGVPSTEDSCAPDADAPAARKAEHLESTALAVQVTTPIAPRARDAIWDALSLIFGEPLTDNERGKRNVACKQFRDAARAANLTGPQMAVMVATAHRAWPNVMRDASETPNGLASNLSLLLNGPQVNGRDAGIVRQHTQRLTERATVTRGGAADWKPPADLKPHRPHPLAAKESPR